MLLHADLPLEWVGPATVVGGLTAGGLIYTAGWRRYRRRLPGRFAAVTTCCLPGRPRLPGHRDRLPAGRGGGPVAERAHGPAHPAAYRGAGAAPARRAAPAAPARSSRFIAPLGRGSAPPSRRFERSARARASARRASPQLRRSSGAGTFRRCFSSPFGCPRFTWSSMRRFFAGGFLFWYPVVQPWPGRPRWPRGAMIPYLLVADVQNTVLAAV